MILCDSSLRRMLPQLVREPDYSLVNPASVDIRVGAELMRETGADAEKIGWSRVLLQNVYFLDPGELVLVSTEEHLMVPNGYAMEIRLKSTAAREGYDQALAAWFDPGWSGVGTLEIRNGRRYRPLPLYRGLLIAQFVIHKLDGLSENVYDGKYNHATTVEAAK